MHWGSGLGVASQLSQNELKGIVFVNLVLLLAVPQDPTTISLRNVGAKSFLTAFRIPASPPPRSPPQGHTPRGKGHRFWVSGAYLLSSVAGELAGERGLPGTYVWECGVWDWFTGRDEPEVTEACLGLRFVCHAVQDGPWSQVDIYLESNELTEYSVEDRERKYSVLLKEGIATFSYCEVFVGI